MKIFFEIRGECDILKTSHIPNSITITRTLGSATKCDISRWVVFRSGIYNNTPYVCPLTFDSKVGKVLEAIAYVRRIDSGQAAVHPIYSTAMRYGIDQ